jgi:hypothetical protein
VSSIEAFFLGFCYLVFEMLGFIFHVAEVDSVCQQDTLPVGIYQTYGELLFRFSEEDLDIGRRCSYLYTRHALQL